MTQLHYPRSGLGREHPAPPDAAPAPQEWVAAAPARSPLQWLRCTDRELRVLELSAEGHSAKTAAVILGLEATTIRTYRSDLLHKIGARNIAHAVALAYQDGILTVGQQLPTVIVGGVQYEAQRRLAA